MAAVHLTSLKLFYDEGVKGEQHYVFLLCYVYIYISISIVEVKIICRRYDTSPYAIIIHWFSPWFFL